MQLLLARKQVGKHMRIIHRSTMCRWCDVDLAYYFLESSGHIEDSREDGHRRVSAEHDVDEPAKFGGSDEPVSSWHDLKSPSDFSKTVGRIRVQTQSATLQVGSHHD